MNHEQKVFIQLINEALAELSKANLALKLFVLEKKHLSITFENSPLYEAIELRKNADIKEAESKLRSMKKALRDATIIKYKIDEEVDNLIKEFA